MYIRGESRMSLMKKSSVLMLVMIALIVPAVALTDNAAGAVNLNSEVQAGGFDDRGAGSVTFRVHNTGEDSVVVNITIVDLENQGTVYYTSSVTVPGEGSTLVTARFTVGSAGSYYGLIKISGEGIDPAAPTSSMSFHFTVDRSMWSNTGTYLVIIAVIAIAGIGIFIKMRSTPKAPVDTGTFTAMEEERKAGRKETGTGKERYKGRSKE